MDKDPIAMFVEKIVADAGLDKLPEEFKNDYMLKMHVEIQKRLGVMAIKELDKKGQDEYATMIESGKELEPQKVYDFLKERIPEFEQKIITILEEFGKEFKEGISKMQGFASDAKV